MDAPEIRFIWSLDHAYPVGRQDRHFYFLFPFLLSRKVRNVTTKPPKVQSNVNIPMNIEIISKAVIITHLPSYVFRLAGYWLGRLPPCHGHSSYVFPRKNSIAFHSIYRNVQTNICSANIRAPAYRTVPSKSTLTTFIVNPQNSDILIPVWRRM